jgi:hypothetical protein
MKTLQKFSSVHDQVRNHFNLECHLVARQVYKQRWLTALAASFEAMSTPCVGAVRLRTGGAAVLIVSDELDELSVCDRVLVIFKGRLTEEFPAGWSSEKLVAAIEGIRHGEPAG